MTERNAATIAYERALERLRQERETFNQLKAQEAQWFRLRLGMGYVAVVLLPAVALISSYILYEHKNYTDAVVTIAGAALFTDVLGLIITVWRIVLAPASTRKLSPVTKLPTGENMPD